MPLLRRLLYRPLRHIVDRWSREMALDLAKAELAASDELSPQEKAWVAAVESEIAPGDQMFVSGEGRHYLGVGLSALRNIEEALQVAGRDEPIRQVLDFPCGYGRVLRFLKVRFPEAAFMGCELQAEAVRFCRRCFDIETAPSEPDFSRIQLDRRFDLVWCGSLVTHLDEASTSALLACFDRHLAEGGICLFTTHGKATEDLLGSGQRSYSLGQEAQERVLADYHATGFGFGEYDDWPGYGISLTRPEKIRELADSASGGTWEELLYRQRGWDGHQDVFAYRKLAATS